MYSFETTEEGWEEMEGTEFYLRFPGLGQPGQAGNQIIKQELTAQRTREGNGNPLQSSCPENPMDRGAW